MSLPASRARTVFRACVVNAVRESETLIGKLIEVTRNALTEEESNGRDVRQRALVGDALRQLQGHAAALVKGYPTALLEIFAEGPSQPKARQGRDGGMDFGELALMDDADVMAQVELSRAQQIAVHATEASLAELNTLVSAAQGLHSVQPESNPFRPENYIRALQQVVGETGVSGDVRQLWMRHMREQLGALLVDTYQRAAESLRQHGVEPVGYAVAGTAGVPRSAYGGYAGGGAATGYPATAYGAEAGARSAYGGGYGSSWGSASAGVPLAPEAEEALLTVGILRQMLAGGGDPFAYDTMRSGHAPVGGVPAMVPVAPPSGYLPPAAAEAMEDIAQLERLVGRLSAAQAAPVATGWNSGMAPAAAAVPTSPARTAHEVVGRMMENIAQDSRLLPSVQRAVQSLEPALKQLVLHDTRFFSDGQHPARRLLDELTQRSLAFRSEDAPAFSRFMRLVDEVVGHLSAVEIRDAAPFDHVLKALEKAWTAQERQQRERREAKQRELLQREQRELLAEQFAAGFRALPDAAGAPEDWLAFVTGPWADVAALARSSQQGGEGDPGGCQALAPLLLRCAQPDQLRADPDGLGAALANMAPAVRQGLESIGHPAERIAQVLERLAQLQQQAQEYAAAVPADEAQDAEPPPPPAEPQVPEPAPAEPAVAGPVLRVGQWVEVVNNQRVVRTQLTWCSPHNTLFLFTGADGSTQSMTRRMIDKLAAEGAFKLLSSQPVVARALSDAKSGGRSKPKAR